MKNECSIVRDLLPLYAESMVSPETASFMEEHLKDCEHCRKEYERLKAPCAVPAQDDAAPLLMLQKKMAAKRLWTIVLTAVFAVALLVSAFAVLDAPVYLPYTEELLAVEPVGENGLQITFDPSVTDFNYTVYQDPDGGNFYYCDVEAWYSLWDRWFSGGEELRTAVVFPAKPYPVTVMYCPNDGTESICVYGEAGEGGSIALPRLALGYYLILAVLALAVLFAAWLVAKGRPRQRAWIERIMLYPVSYLISHGIVVGFRAISYSLVRDFRLILFVSLLLYCGLLLAHSVWGMKKEIRETAP